MNTTSKHFLRLSGLTGLILLANLNEGHTATATTNMNVKVNVVGHCTISATDFLFEDYDGTGGQALIQSPQTPITVTCANGVGYTIGASAGSGSFTTRTMKNGANSINYNLYTDNGYATVWNNSTQLVNGNGNGSPQTPTIYGQIPANQTVNTGLLYSDILTLTLKY
ncbi:MAG: spore coat U domain-containing protein [Alphaproteobacteria bacterium]|nr:spore coat U domain-containing protein [Alphaproteobacteria bacterium]